jgi:hypothetical protein
MSYPIARREFVGSVASTAIVGPMLAQQAMAEDGSKANPDGVHVISRRWGWLVLPTGGDDHDNLEWALRHTPRGGVVRLVRGTYKVGSPVIVPNFDGILEGAGTQGTTLTCTDELNYELWVNSGGAEKNRPPDFPRVPIDGSATKSTPGMILFYKRPPEDGDDLSDHANSITVRRIRCRGAMRGEPWAFGDEVLSITVINSIDWADPGVRQVTTRQDFTLSDVDVDGFASGKFGVFGNGCACITALGGLVLTDNYDLQGAVGDALSFQNGGLLDVTPAQGNVTIERCWFKNCRLGPGVIGYRDGIVRAIGNRTDGCRGNCLQFIDLDNMRVIVRDNHLFCDPIELPDFLTAGAAGVPSSLGCIVVAQGLTAALGMPYNVQFAALAAKERNPDDPQEFGPKGTWRPQGQASAPRSSNYWVVDNDCVSSTDTPNTYCYHLIDVAHLAFQNVALTAVVEKNTCSGSRTCIGLDHVAGALVARNDCESRGFGIELHNCSVVGVRRNRFEFPAGDEACEIRVLQLGDKLDLSRVVEGAGTCVEQ